MRHTFYADRVLWLPLVLAVAIVTQTEAQTAEPNSDP
jgi:hypothetical protein